MNRKNQCAAQTDQAVELSSLTGPTGNVLGYAPVQGYGNPRLVAAVPGNRYEKASMVKTGSPPPYALHRIVSLILMSKVQFQERSAR